MKYTVYSTSEKVRCFIWILVVTFVLWFALTARLDWQETICGILVCLIISFFGAHIYFKLGLPSFAIKGILFSIVYVIVLLREVIKANIDVAYHIIHPKMPIKPGIVVIKIHLKPDITKTILSNSITLIPRTFILDVIGDKLLVHRINVKAEGSDENTSLISDRFEKYLRVIYLHNNWYIKQGQTNGFRQNYSNFCL